MDVGLLNHDGEIVRHRHRQTRPAMFLQAIAPSRADRVVAVACLFPWDWRADLCAQDGRPCVRGHALSMQAIQGGQATHDTIDAQKMAVRLRGGLVPQASVAPAALRAPRDLLRRRIALVRTRAEWLPHVQHANRQYTVPAIGTAIASKTNRPEVAERLPAPAVPNSIEVDRALLDDDAQRLRALAWTMVQTAPPHDAHTLDVRQTVPGIGKILRRVLV